jgi:O-antigen ligase
MCELAVILGVLGGIVIGALGITGWAVMTTARLASKNASRTLTFALGTILYVFLSSCTSGPQMPVSPLLDDEPSCHDEMPQEKEL